MYSELIISQVYKILKLLIFIYIINYLINKLFIFKSHLKLFNVYIFIIGTIIETDEMLP